MISSGRIAGVYSSQVASGGEGGGGYYTQVPPHPSAVSAAVFEDVGRSHNGGYVIGLRGPIDIPIQYI